MNQRQGGGGWFDGNNKQFNSDGVFNGQFNNQEQDFGGNNNAWQGNQTLQRNFNANDNGNNSFWASINNDRSSGGHNTNFNNSGRYGGHGGGGGGGSGSGYDGKGGGGGGGLGRNNYMANDNFDNQRTNRNMNCTQNFRGNRENINSGRAVSRGGVGGSNMETPIFNNENDGSSMSNSNVTGDDANFAQKSKSCGDGGGNKTGNIGNQQTGNVNKTDSEQVVAYPNVTGIKLQKNQSMDVDDRSVSANVSPSLPHKKVPQKTPQPLICFEQPEKLEDEQKIIQQLSPKPQRMAKVIPATITTTTTTTLNSTQKRTSEVAKFNEDVKSFKIPKLTVSNKQENIESIPTPPPPPKISSSQVMNQTMSPKSVEPGGEDEKSTKIIFDYSNNILKDSSDVGYRIITETNHLTGVTKTLNVQTVPFMLLPKDEQVIIIKQYLPHLNINPTENRIIAKSNLSPRGECVIQILDPDNNKLIVSSIKGKFRDFNFADTDHIIRDYIEKDKLINVNLYTAANIKPVVSEKDIIPVYKRSQLSVSILKYCDERGYENIKRDTKLAKVLHERLIQAAKLSVDTTKLPSFTYVGILDSMFRVNCLNSETRIWLEHSLSNWMDELCEYDDENMAGNSVTNFSLVLRKPISDMKKIYFVITADIPKSWPIMSKRIKIQNPRMSPDDWITDKIEPFMGIGVKYDFYVPKGGLNCNSSIGGVFPGGRGGGDSILKLYFGLDSLIINVGK